MNKIFKKDEIVYIQGIYKGRITEEFKHTVSIIPLEGVLEHEKGKSFTYAKDLIKKTKDKK